MTVRHLDRLLCPASIALFGASSRPGSVGAAVWRNLRAGQFAGPIYPVNPKHSLLDGEPVFASAAQLPTAPDLAVICTPAATIPRIVAELGERGTRAAIVVTAGMSALQKQAALDAARPHVLRLLGPNCIGLLSPHLGLNASFAHTDALPGDIAFVSQSGALVTAVLDWTRSRGIGLSHMISLGDHCDVDFGDLLDHLASDARTRSILLYIESVESPRKFMSAARAAARNKPVIVVKAGRAGGGLLAAASHTGALAGSDLVYDAAIRRAGMLRVDTLHELFIAAETLARFRANHSEVLTIMTNGGGAGVMAADAAARAGIALAEPGKALLDQLDAVLPGHWCRANPIDIVGDAPVERYTATLSALLADPAAGAILFVHAPTAMVRSDDIAKACLPVLRTATPRVLGCWLGDASVAQARQLFEQAGVPDYPTPEDAVRAFEMLQTYRRNQALLTETPASCERPAPELAKVRRTLEEALSAGREWLDEVEAKSLLQAYGIPTVRTMRVDASAQAVVEAAEQLGYPVALKIVSDAITHKSDVGGVRLDLRDATMLSRAVDDMLRSVAAARPDAPIDGLSVQAMACRPHAQEVIVGAKVDNVFGPVVLCGQGGTAVEVFADTAVALPPLNRSLARELVARTRMARLLAGYRNHPPARMDALYDVLIAVSEMLADLPALAELDINPLWVDEQGALALDARVRLASVPACGTDRFSILPYPQQWVRHLAWEGRSITVRPIRPEDEAQHDRFLRSLDPEDMRLRFFQMRRDLPHSELARLTQIDYDREMAFIAESLDVQGQPETLGVARTVCDPDKADAEYAILVRSDLKGHGLGRILFEQLIEHAQSRGIGRLVGIVLRENTRMLRLARALGFHEDVAAAPDPTTRRMVKPLCAAATECTPSSLAPAE
ncbi:bifunctional acetate--CoA ligase family protein/GNAT family N-acetyltransferase [Variovorax sp. JS1663]|uniref:bifunctional acetate--CoA ligase family protein/GNAT family N-acetyltransferase n=1 Tax=Variovorax sp. JS1663 TaxID=1851577 RepID=UPI000B34413F|nr:bifunctional acetate--CoA ligase family protein/GNAT family N-acetyltransferase [Variovorax sp. JS1663]OUM00911.1 GCN5 family acetyltransferase [Variovorax sp. JS1663]